MDATLEQVSTREPGATGAATGVDLADLIATFNDVTARLQGTHESLRGEVARLESELRDARQQLQRARELASLGEMAAGIAHEVRNPLGSIRLYVSALANDLADRPQEQDLARKIGGAVSRLDAVVNDVLAFARQQRARPTEVCAGELIDDALFACADLIDGHGVRVIAPTSCARRLTVRCDAALVRQALVNVVRNACQAMAEAEPRGQRVRTLRLGAERKRVLESEGNRRSMTAFEVADTGPGVPESVRERLFAPFFTTRHTGTGLGLAIVHRIIDAHGGRVHIRNRTGAAGGIEGATVELLLPAPNAHNAERGDS